MKITQKMLAFDILYKAYKKDPEEFLPTWYFVGEFQVSNIETWHLASYKCPARLSDLYTENPGLLDRKMIVGKSGSQYYAYRIAPNPKPELIRDESIKKFYEIIRWQQESLVK